MIDVLINNNNNTYIERDSPVVMVQFQKPPQIEIFRDFFK